jgi:two-component system chemotaxis response regulator CheY
VFSAADREVPTLDPEAESKLVLQRLTAMGVKARLMTGDRCVLASLRLQNPSFGSLTGAQRIDQVVFSSVGIDRIKCLRPRALFQLPLIRIGDCRDSTAIEARIRLAWKRHQSRLQETRAWLDVIGTRSEVCEEGSVLAFPISGENQRARACMIAPREVILPGLGPLTGITLQRREDRLMRVDPSGRSAVELDIAVSTRLEELCRLDRRLSEERRHLALSQAETKVQASSSPRARRVRVLMVGPRLCEAHACIQSLRLRGYVVETAAGEREGLEIFDRTSPELVLADFEIGRGGGAEFVVALRQLAGIEEIPVVLVDDSRRETRREVARRVGAAGYLVHPVDVPRIAKRLQALVSEPQRRRYTRYASRLPVQVHGVGQPCLATAVGRGGMFVATEHDLEAHSLRRCELSLPELGAHIDVDAEVIYRRGAAGRERAGVGLRFQAFPNADEHILIDYLRGIDRTSSTVPQA